MATVGKLPRIVKDAKTDIFLKPNGSGHKSQTLESEKYL